MFGKKNQIFVSTSNYEYKFVDVDEILKNMRQYFVLSYHIGFKNFDFTPISKIEEQTLENQEVYDLSFVNSSGTEYNITDILPTQKIFTKGRNYMIATKVNDLDIFIDYTGQFCKITKKQSRKVDSINILSIDAAYNNNFICNGILFKDNA